MAPEMVEIAGKQIEVATCKNGLYKVEHNDLEELGQEWNKTEYRYAGVNYTDVETSYVHNYVSFNNEIWRIIGLVNVKVGDSVEQRLKIVRTDGVGEQKNFGNYEWDGIGPYLNDWNTSKLKDILNDIYYDSSLGACKNDLQNSCDFTGTGKEPKGLNDTAKNMIDKDVTWNLGGWSTSEITTRQFYEKERGTTVYINKPTEWSSITDVGGNHNGIGLMYPSDYGYAVGGDVRNNCLTKNLHSYNEDNCNTNDWLVSTNDLWTISPFSLIDTYAFLVISSGYVVNGYVNYDAEVWPVGYLTPSTKIISGEGTMEEPYILQIES